MWSIKQLGTTGQAAYRLPYGVNKYINGKRSLAPVILQKYLVCCCLMLTWELITSHDPPISIPLDDFGGL